MRCQLRTVKLFSSRRRRLSTIRTMSYRNELQPVARLADSARYATVSGRRWGSQVRIVWSVSEIQLWLGLVSRSLWDAGVARDHRLSFVAAGRGTTLCPRSLCNTMKTFYWLSALMAVFSFFNFVEAEIIIPPPGLEPGEQYRLIFTTSERRDATSMDIDDYNGFVQSVADSSPELAALDSEWRALAATASVDAVDNAMLTFTDSEPGVPMYRVDGELFASDYESFWTLPVGTSLPLLDINELGATLPADPMPDIATVSVWTGFRRQLPPRAGPPGKLGTRQVVVGDASRGRLLFEAEVGVAPQLRRLYGISGVITAVPEPGSNPSLVFSLSIFAVFRGNPRRP